MPLELPEIKKGNVVFRKIRQDEKIPLGAFHSLSEGDIMAPIMNQETIGQTPADFSPDRSFYDIHRIVFDNED